jgi:hypothetical protein
MKYYTAKALGRVLGIGEDRVNTLARAGVIREGRADNGLFTLEESAREVIASMEKQGEARESADYATERARLMRVKRKNAEHDLSIREKDLHTTEDIELVIARILTSFKAKIRSIPARVAPQCAKINSQEDIFDLLKQVTDEALQELSDLGGLFKDDEEDGQNGEYGA